MTTFKLDVDQETYEKIVELAFRNRRTTRGQAEWMLMQAVKHDEEAARGPATGDKAMYAALHE